MRTGAWQDYKWLARLGYDHQPNSQRGRLLLGQGLGEPRPRAHRIISNLKTWPRGTYRGVSEHQLLAYLNEFVFRLRICERVGRVNGP